MRKNGFKHRRHISYVVAVFVMRRQCQILSWGTDVLEHGVLNVLIFNMSVCEKVFVNFPLRSMFSVAFIWDVAHILTLLH